MASVAQFQALFVPSNSIKKSSLNGGNAFFGSSISLRRRALEELRSSLYHELRTTEGAKRQQQRFCGPVLAMTFNLMVSVGIILGNKMIRTARSRIRVQTGNNLECSATTTSRRTHALFPAGIPPDRMSTGLRAMPSPLGISSRSRNGHSDSRIALAKARTRVGLRQNRISSRFCM
ncbi:hypothetical protein SASPL_144227 [Salvia splendens]|uniref:Uncharacterized protein n=1 Tax=Salvia splendens TaxID=180675 RepID=A0A8X8ZAG4_SALSN|nr:hypothetical protein SASPL_144227 [Salvia splendens]